MSESDTAGGTQGAVPVSRLTAINPVELGSPSGYSNGMLAPRGGRLLFVAGQVAWDAERRLKAEDFVGQFAGALENVVSVVEAAGGTASDIARLTIYVTDRREYLTDLKAVGETYRRIMGRHYPAMALVQVAGLIEDGAKLEIEATAVLKGEE